MLRIYDSFVWLGYVQLLEEYTMGLLVNLDIYVNECVQNPVEILFEMRNGVEWIAAEQYRCY